jgi:hypothetical protein
VAKAAVAEAAVIGERTAKVVPRITMVTEMHATVPAASSVRVVASVKAGV